MPGQSDSHSEAGPTHSAGVAAHANLDLPLGLGQTTQSGIARKIDSSECRPNSNASGRWSQESAEPPVQTPEAKEVTSNQSETAPSSWGGVLGCKTSASSMAPAIPMSKIIPPAAMRPRITFPEGRVGGRSGFLLLCKTIVLLYPEGRAAMSGFLSLFRHGR